MLFRATNLTNSYKETNSFSVTNGASYNSNDYNIGSVTTNLDTCSVLLKFKFGEFGVRYDYRNDELSLQGGRVADSLVIERYSPRSPSKIKHSCG